MGFQKCPRCGSAVQPTDHVCLECDLDLIEARKKITADTAQAGLVVTSSQQRAAVAPTAAAGVATDIGEDTRLREFDEHLAEQLRAERGAAVLTAILGVAIGIAFLVVGFRLLSPAGGLKALGSLTPAYFREQGFGIFGNPVFLGAMALALGLAGVLAGLGQFHRAWTGTQAIEDVKFGGRPRIVGISSFTTAGLVLGSFVLPPLGLVLGILFKFSKDDDTRDLGGRMIMAALVAAGLLIIDLIVHLVSGLTQVQLPARSSTVQ